ncbi:META domain-containing protein [Wohlfahrtiimonas larvae]|uniref:Heat shock protein HslJ n=1 Tax=Wohlfahrtiimonas larvae TaxID=1157986 RepID=A0ABP9N200_9GAMM|nr:META domain-containing protein [Wohlfahrtiimonas larvae]
MNKILISVATLLFVTACATTEANMSNNPNIVTVKDIQHHNYILAEIDGKTYRTAKNAMSPNISFGEKMHVSGSMCNNYFGQGELKNGVLTVKALGMTEKFCADRTLNNLDRKIGQLLSDGAKLTLDNDGQNLTLSNASTTLKFALKDYVN